jgi:hypothetical protein
MPQIDPDWVVTVGDFCFNRRASLDYLIAALVRRTGQVEDESNQFPIYCPKRVDDWEDDSLRQKASQAIAYRAGRGRTRSRFRARPVTSGGGRDGLFGLAARAPGGRPKAELPRGTGLSASRCARRLPASLPPRTPACAAPRAGSTPS